MIKVSRFFKELKSNCESEPDYNELFPYWEKVRYFKDLEEAYKYYANCVTCNANCALTISNEDFEHTVLTHYTGSFPEQMKKSFVMLMKS